jgi:coenzyme PQQ precursor peptide PqqA
LRKIFHAAQVVSRDGCTAKTAATAPVTLVCTGWAVLLAQNGVLVALYYRRMRMTWTTPTLVEICIGLEINGYLPAEF